MNSCLVWMVVWVSYQATPTCPGRKNGKSLVGANNSKLGSLHANLLSYNRNITSWSEHNKPQRNSLTFWWFSRFDDFKWALSAAVAASGEISDQKSHIVQFDICWSSHNSRQALDWHSLTTLVHQLSHCNVMTFCTHARSRRAKSWQARTRNAKSRMN